MRLTSRQSISPWRVARRVFRHRREHQAARRKQPEASPRHWLRRGPPPPTHTLTARPRDHAKSPRTPRGKKSLGFGIVKHLSAHVLGISGPRDRLVADAFLRSSRGAAGCGARSADPADAAATKNAVGGASRCRPFPLIRVYDPRATNARPRHPQDFEMPELPKMPWDSGGEDAGEVGRSYHYQ